tara:strand:+ start:46 stop:600 length:555 start_codon:yes stop_codon:yes gene_type:complete
MKRFFNDVILFTPTVYHDHRGLFFQSFDKQVQDVTGHEFVQDNHSYSHKNVIRGLHYQWDSPMGKLVRVVRGSAIDYFVDIRKDSPTYGQYDCVELNTENYSMIWIPEGFAHGFVSLEDHTTVLYRCTAYYNPVGESGINIFDPDIAIDWPIKKEDALISERDVNSQSFQEYSKNIKFNLPEQK